MVDEAPCFFVNCSRCVVRSDFLPSAPPAHGFTNRRADRQTAGNRAERSRLATQRRGGKQLSRCAKAWNGWLDMMKLKRSAGKRNNDDAASMTKRAVSCKADGCATHAHAHTHARTHTSHTRAHTHQTQRQTDTHARTHTHAHAHTQGRTHPGCAMVRQMKRHDMAGQRASADTW